MAAEIRRWFKNIFLEPKDFVLSSLKHAFVVGVILGHSKSPDADFAAHARSIFLLETAPNALNFFRDNASICSPLYLFERHVQRRESILGAFFWTHICFLEEEPKN